MTTIHSFRRSHGAPDPVGGFSTFRHSGSDGISARRRPDAPACLVLDVRLPSLRVSNLQRELAGGVENSIIFITGHGDIPM